MGENSNIEWTDATFNPWWGCRRVSPACDHCYADTWALRLGMKLWDNGQYRTFGAKHWAEPLKWNRKAEAEGRRLRVFCASMADVFDKDGPASARADLWDLVEDTPHLDWLLLTKRVGNVERMMSAHWQGIFPRNAWLGISVANQIEADRDIPKLLAIPAEIRFLSCEPLLGQIDLNQASEDLLGLHWIIVGGESGHDARAISPLWVDSLRLQCRAADIAFFFKQWGEWAPSSELGFNGHEKVPTQIFPPHVLMRVGKKAAGRTLDGITYSEWPNRRAIPTPEG